MNNHILLLILSWVTYFVIHSLLASLWFKQWVGNYCPRCLVVYRLSYNILATILLLIPLMLMIQWKGQLLWQWQGVMLWFMNGLSLLAILGFIVTLKYYDMSEFLGFKQLKEFTESEPEQFTISPFHRYVRHPWYFFAIVIMWTRPMDSMMLTSVIAMTLYFAIGLWLEERKLVQHYGDIYCRYQQQVPALIPLPWRFLRSGENYENTRN